VPVNLGGHSDDARARQSLADIQRKIAKHRGQVFNAPMPDDLLYIAIDDAIAHAISTKKVALNRLAPPLKRATDRDLVVFDPFEIRVFKHLHVADFAAGRPDDGILLRVLTRYWIGRAVTEAEAKCRAAWETEAQYTNAWKVIEAQNRAAWETEAQRRAAKEVAAIEKRLRAGSRQRRPPPSQPPPPRLRRFQVEGELVATCDCVWQQEQLELWYMAADRSMVKVPRLTGLRLCRLTPDGDWVIAQRDRTADEPVFVGIHITKAGLCVLMKAVEDKLTPPVWLVLRTHAELEDIRKDANITPERWAFICSLYEERLYLRTERPPMDTPEGSADPLEGDRPWARSEKINVRTELPALRRAYLGQLRKPR
jgi:hypothetical protein